MTLVCGSPVSVFSHVWLYLHISLITQNLLVCSGSHAPNSHHIFPSPLAVSQLLCQICDHGTIWKQSGNIYHKKKKTCNKTLFEKRQIISFYFRIPPTISQLYRKEIHFTSFKCILELSSLKHLKVKRPKRTFLFLFNYQI